MTRNLSVGSELGPVIAASTVEEALIAVPEVVGPQEAVSLRSGPLERDVS